MAAAGPTKNELPLTTPVKHFRSGAGGAAASASNSSLDDTLLSPNTTVATVASEAYALDTTYRSPTPQTSTAANLSTDTNSRISSTPISQKVFAINPEQLADYAHTNSYLLAPNSGRLQDFLNGLNTDVVQALLDERDKEAIASIKAWSTARDTSVLPYVDFEHIMNRLKTLKNESTTNKELLTFSTEFPYSPLGEGISPFRIDRVHQVILAPESNSFLSEHDRVVTRIGPNNSVLDKIKEEPENTEMDRYHVSFHKALVSLIKDGVKTSETEAQTIYTNIITFLSQAYSQSIMNLPQCLILYHVAPKEAFKKALEIDIGDDPSQLTLTVSESINCFRLSANMLSREESYNEMAINSERLLFCSQLKLVVYPTGEITDPESRLQLVYAGLSGPDALATIRLISLCTDPSLDSHSVAERLSRHQALQEQFIRALTLRTDIAKNLLFYGPEPEQYAMLAQFLSLNYFLPQVPFQLSIVSIDHNALFAFIKEASGLAFMLIVKNLILKIISLEHTSTYARETTTTQKEKEALIIQTTQALANLKTLITYLSNDETTQRNFAKIIQIEWFTVIPRDIESTNKLLNDFRSFIRTINKSLNGILKKLKEDSTSPFERLCSIIRKCTHISWHTIFSRVILDEYESAALGITDMGGFEVYNALKARNLLDPRLPNTLTNGLKILEHAIEPEDTSKGTLDCMLKVAKDQLLRYLTNNEYTQGVLRNLIKDEWFCAPAPSSPKNKANFSVFLHKLIISFAARPEFLKEKDNSTSQASRFEHICSMLVRTLHPDWLDDFATSITELYQTNEEIKKIFDYNDSISRFFPSTTPTGLPRTLHKGLELLRSKRHLYSPPLPAEAIITTEMTTSSTIWSSPNVSAVLEPTTPTRT